MPRRRVKLRTTIVVSVVLITTLLAVYLWWFRRIHRFPQSLLLLPVGMLLMWLANVVRITALILVGIWISPEIAVDGFHSAAGWIAFLTVGLGIIWGASRSPFFTTPEGLAAGGGALGVRLGTPIPERDSAESIVDEDGAYPMEVGQEANVRTLQSAVGLVWRAVVLWMLLLAMLSVAVWLG